MEEKNTAAAVQPQTVALPAFLPQRLQAFRIGKGDRMSYVVKDKLQNKTYDFEPWQYFVLEVLPGCEDEQKLATIFQDRFGYALPRNEVQHLFAQLADAGLLNEDAAKHPLLKLYATKTYSVEDGQPKVKSFRDKLGSAPAEEAKPDKASGPVTKPEAKKPEPAPALSPADTLLAGLQDAVGFDPRAHRGMLVLFDPRRILKVIAPPLTPLKNLVYVLPLIAFAAFYLAIRYGYLIDEDVQRLLGGKLDFFEHTAYGLLSADLLVTITTAVLAYKYRATVDGIGLVLLMSFIPRFTPRISHTEQLQRGERMWLHGAPLLVRLGLFSFGMLLWYGTRQTNQKAAEVGLSLAMVGIIGLALCANPLVKSSGYHLLAAFVNEPHLRGKAFQALWSKIRGGTFKEADGMLVATYGLTSAAFMFVMIVGAMIVLASALKQLQIGGSALIIVGLVGFDLTRRTINYFIKVNAAYERTLQFDRWRKRALPAEVSAAEAPAPPPAAWKTYLWRAAPLALLTVMFLPYSYSAGGTFTIYPNLQQAITTDVSGLIKEVYFDGGETVTKGTVIARLVDMDNQSQVEIYAAKLKEQQAVIAELKSRPRPETVTLAQRALDVAMTQAAFSKNTLDRDEKLFTGHVISGEELDSARRTYEIDLKQIDEKKASLQVARAGATPDEIAAAQAKWDSLKAERDAFQSKVDRAVLVMPFDGRLLTLHLKQRANSFYKSGEPFASAEDTGQVTAEIEVPEADVEFVRTSALVRARPAAYSSEMFTGKVRMMDWNVTERPFGKVMKVVAVFENTDSRLRNGMTGYAKIDGPALPTWKAFSLGVLRFVDVQVWSWIP